MILQRLQTDTVGLKLSQGLAHITREGVVKVGDRPTEGPGEYDINGVGIHLTDNVGVLFTEGVRIGIVWPSSGKPKFDEDTNSDVLIFFISDEKQIIDVLKEQDPRIIVLTDESTAETIAKQDGVEIIKEASYKLTAQTLPADVRAFVLLV